MTNPNCWKSAKKKKLEILFKILQSKTNFFPISFCQITILPLFRAKYPFFKFHTQYFQIKDNGQISHNISYVNEWNDSHMSSWIINSWNLKAIDFIVFEILTDTVVYLKPIVGH